MSGQPSKKAPKKKYYKIIPGKHQRTHIRWAIDYDYVEKLNDEEAEWLSRFTDEYYSGNFNHTPNIHSKEQRRELYRSNNERWRDGYNKWNRNDPTDQEDVIDYEDLINHVIDRQNIRVVKKKK